MSHLSHSQAQAHEEERRPFAAQSSSPPPSSSRHPRSSSSSPTYQAVDKSRLNTTTTTSDPAAYESDSDSETNIDSSSSSSLSRGQTTPLVQNTTSEETLLASEATGAHSNHYHHHHHRPHQSPLRRRVTMLLATLSQIGLFIFFGALAGAVVKAPWVYPYSWHPICMGLYGFVATEGKNDLLKPKGLAIFIFETVDHENNRCFFLYFSHLDFAASRKGLPETSGTDNPRSGPDFGLDLLSLGLCGHLCEQGSTGQGALPHEPRPVWVHDRVYFLPTSFVRVLCWICP